ncbi:MutS-related protein [Crocinitomix algicola]|uniref:MutS-related protein n=1 Tax=Crocinitomix algicola TaxID=1740263 RepID=UPI00083539CD|nr:hypothetical protein [Crocinitomix algicola]
MSEENTINPVEFYTKQLEHWKVTRSKVKTKLFWVGMLRLTVFAVTICLIYLLSNYINIAVVVGVSGMAIFLYMVSKNADIKLEKKRCDKLIELNELEIEFSKGNFKNAETGEEFIGENHYYNQDIDLFGHGSIFQYINRTNTEPGRKKLAALLNENTIDHIKDKQEAIKELNDRPKWRQNFQVTAGLIKTAVDHQVILKWLKNYQSVLPNFIAKLPLIISLISLSGLVAYGLDLISGSLLSMWFFFGLGITGVFLKKVNKLYLSASQMTETISQYSKLLKDIEDQQFSSHMLIELQNNIQNKSKKASEIVESLAKDLNNLDQRNNIFFALLANGFFLWDLRYAYRIEQWIKKFQTTTETWFETIAVFEAYNSLANFAYNRPQHVYPELSTNEKDTIKAIQLGHPLLNETQRVSNDFAINNQDFYIITGANMAGKSTFLRTVALNIVMANIGLPVCAKEFVYRPIKLISSMRTSDSLVNDESYFFSELKRLKYIVNEIEKDRYFIILDEILKGTNSKDKAEGSAKFIERLVASNSTGLIATHDLSLCALSTSLPQVENYYFDAEIVNNELYFDYRFKNGICKNMNASFLLKKMEIV